jgi:type IV pilus assembly protein PilW
MPPSMSKSLQSSRFARGFGLVELMIGVVLALVASVIIFQVFAQSERRTRTTTAQVDAQDFGLIALLSVEREARHAGLGFIGFGRGSDRQVVCRTVNRYDSTSGAMVVDTLMPLRIIDGGASGSDSIEVTYGTSTFSATPAHLVVNAVDSDPATGLLVSNSAAGRMFANGDTILVAEPASPTKPCARLRITGQAIESSGIRLRHAASDTANPPSTVNIFPTSPMPGYETISSNPALVINVGTLSRMRYRLNGTAFEALNLTAATSEVLATEIVSVQAQYGITANAMSQDVVQWVNATGAWAAPAAADVVRIKAVRIAIVSRAHQPDTTNVTANCSTPGGTVNSGPCAWLDDSTTSPAPAIDLSGLGSDWRQYRYRVFETVVPLRNVIWGDVTT